MNLGGARIPNVRCVPSSASVSARESECSVNKWFSARSTLSLQNWSLNNSLMEGDFQ